MVRSTRRHLIDNEKMKYSNSYTNNMIGYINKLLENFKNDKILKNINTDNFYYDLNNNPDKYLEIMYKFAKVQESQSAEKILKVFPLRSNIVPKYIKIDKEVIKEILIQPKLWSLYDSDKIWKEYFSKLFTDKKNKKIINKKDYVFNEMICTDGYSASIILRHVSEKKGFGKSKKKKVKHFIDFEYVTNLTTDKLDKLNNYKIIGIDPGINNILTIVDESKNKLSYTMCQRQVECGYKRKQNVFNKEKLNFADIESVLSKYNSKTTDIIKFKEYIKIKNNINKQLFDQYEKELWRKYRWKTFISTQKSEFKLIERIKNTFNKENKKLCVMYGNWNRQTNMKYMRPTPKIGIKRLINRHFELYNIDEYNTSKKCHFCDDEMERFMNREIDGKNKLLHSLLRCKNVNCNELCKGKNRIMNRDINGALNILQISRDWITTQTRAPKFMRLNSNDGV